MFLVNEGKGNSKYILQHVSGKVRGFLGYLIKNRKDTKIFNNLVGSRLDSV